MKSKGQYQTEKRKKRTRKLNFELNIQNLNYSTKLVWPNLKTLGE